MKASRHKDQVFQLSLTEIAFIITFLLMLLLGYTVVKEEAERKAAQAKLAAINDGKQAAAAFSNATAELTRALAAHETRKPNEVISKLVEATRVQEERDRLKQEVDDLSAKLSALSELEERIQKAAPAQHEQIIASEIVAAMVLQSEVKKMTAAAEAETLGKPGKTEENTASRERAPEPPQTKPGSKLTQTSTNLAPSVPPPKTSLLENVKQAIDTRQALKAELKDKLDKELTVGSERAQIAEVATAAREYAKVAAPGLSPANLTKENSDLRGQVAFLKHRLDARGGRDYPPCWADESGKVEFLFALETKPGSISVSPAWPERRNASAAALPGMDVALGGPHTDTDFPARIRAIFDWSRSQSPQCRHYVLLKSSISDAVQSDRVRLAIENFFYKVEARR